MSILFLGDFYYGYDDIHEDIYKISKYIRENRYSVILNLEGPITNSNNEIKKRGEHLRQSRVSIEVLKMLNVVGVSLANNHIMDFGAQGLKDTIDILDHYGIQHSGAGKTIEEASLPIIYFDQGKKYTIYCMTDSYEEAVIATDIQAGCAPIKNISSVSHDSESISAAFLHTGFEYNILPMPRNIKEAKQLIENGFKYVICSHPHLVQPKMNYEDGTAYFSLGNFYFSEFRNEFDEKTIRKKEKGFCNIGYGVLTEGSKESIGFSYCSKKQETIILSDNSIAELRLNTMIIPSYVIQCWKNRNNHNPILMGIQSIDYMLLKMLDLLYWGYGLIRRWI